MRIVHLVVLAAVTSAFAQDGGTELKPKPVVMRVPEGARISVGLGGDPVFLPSAGVFFSDSAFVAVNDEMKRLQAVERNAQMQQALTQGDKVDVPVQGYLVGMAITAFVFLVGGAALGAWGHAQLEHK